MGSVFSNPTFKPRYIPKVVKHEESIQRMVCNYLRIQYPRVIFRSDYSSGLRLTQNQARIHKSLQSGRAFPDIFVFCPMVVDGKQYAGLALELKREGTRIIKRDGELVADLHIREQAAMLKELKRVGYYAEFACGVTEAVNYLDKYFGKPINTSIF